MATPAAYAPSSPSSLSNGPDSPLPRGRGRPQLPPTRRIYVSNLLPDTTEELLREVFGHFGEVVSVKLMMDYTHTPPQPLGYGFVTFTTEESAGKAIKEMNGAKWGSAILRVAAAKRRTPLSPSASGEGPCASEKSFKSMDSTDGAPRKAKPGLDPSSPCFYPTSLRGVMDGSCDPSQVNGGVNGMAPPPGYGYGQPYDGGVPPMQGGYGIPPGPFNNPMPGYGGGGGVDSLLAWGAAVSMVNGLPGVPPFDPQGQAMNMGPAYQMPPPSPYATQEPPPPAPVEATYPPPPPPAPLAGPSSGFTSCWSAPPASSIPFDISPPLVPRIPTVDPNEGADPREWDLDFPMTDLLASLPGHPSHTDPIQQQNVPPPSSATESAGSVGGGSTVSEEDRGEAAGATLATLLVELRMDPGWVGNLVGPEVSSQNPHDGDRVDSTVDGSTASLPIPIPDGLAPGPVGSPVSGSGDLSSSSDSSWDPRIWSATPHDRSIWSIPEVAL